MTQDDLWNYNVQTFLIQLETPFIEPIEILQRLYLELHSKFTALNWHYTETEKLQDFPHCAAPGFVSAGNTNDSCCDLADNPTAHDLHT